MTPLKAIENIQAVKAVPATRYTPNMFCAHPECDKPTDSVHHIFGRPKGEYSDSYFVLLPLDRKTHKAWENETSHPNTMAKRAIPHAIGLCGDGTTGHHGDVEAHRDLIRYEDGQYIWYKRIDTEIVEKDPEERIHMFLGLEGWWKCLGPLDPQPFDWGEKKRKPRKTGEDQFRSLVKIASFRLPAEMYGNEDVKAMLDAALDQFETIWARELGLKKKRTKGASIIDAVMCGLLWVQQHGVQE